MCDKNVTKSSGGGDNVVVTNNGEMRLGKNVARNRLILSLLHMHEVNSR